MLKAILYYILLIAEFMVTIIIGGVAAGMFIAIATKTGYYHTHQDVIEKASGPIAIIFVIIALLVIWLTFKHYKFSKFTLGKVTPATKWMTMLYTTLPIFGFTLAFYALMNLCQIKFLPEEMTKMNYLTYLPYAFFGSFVSAYIYYGAIQEELIKSGKKLWVQMLTLCIMMLPMCLLVVTSNGDISLDFTFLGMVSTIYGCWIYCKTRSTIILFVVYLIPNLIPSSFHSTPLCIALVIVGIIMTVYGGYLVLRNLPEMLTTEDNAYEDE